MPTNMQRLTGVLVSIGITVGGAWVASTAHSNTEDKTLTSFADGLNITVENVRNDSGNVVVMVFADRDAFKAYDVTKAADYIEIPSKQGSVSARFPDLNSGPDAVAAFHDEDQNQDLNMDGEQPIEGYATSGAVDAYDVSTFKKASLSNPYTAITMYYAD